MKMADYLNWVLKVMSRITPRLWKLQFQGHACTGVWETVYKTEESCLIKRYLKYLRPTYRKWSHSSPHFIVASSKTDKIMKLSFSFPVIRCSHIRGIFVSIFLSKRKEFQDAKIIWTWPHHEWTWLGSCLRVGLTILNEGNVFKLISLGDGFILSGIPFGSH